MAARKPSGGKKKAGAKAKKPAPKVLGNDPFARGSAVREVAAQAPSAPPVKEPLPVTPELVQAKAPVRRAVMQKIDELPKGGTPVVTPPPRFVAPPTPVRPRSPISLSPTGERVGVRGSQSNSPLSSPPVYSVDPRPRAAPTAHASSPSVTVDPRPHAGAPTAQAIKGPTAHASSPSVTVDPRSHAGAPTAQTIKGPTAHASSPSVTVDPRAHAGAPTAQTINGPTAHASSPSVTVDPRAHAGAPTAQTINGPTAHASSPSVTVDPRAHAAAPTAQTIKGPTAHASSPSVTVDPRPHADAPSSQPINGPTSHASSPSVSVDPRPHAASPSVELDPRPRYPLTPTLSRSGERQISVAPTVTEAFKGILNAARASAGIASKTTEVDRWGKDASLASSLRPLGDLLYDKYWRVRVEGADQLPPGPCIIVANHAGALPLDGPVLHLALRRERPDLAESRWLLEDQIFHAPFIGVLANRIGAVRANPENAMRLLDEGRPVIVFPEGFHGLSKPFSERYQLKRFGRGGYVKIALRAGVPIVPAAIVGGEESMPLLGKIPGGLFGVEYLPITVPPLPARWHIRFAAPVSMEGAPAEPEHDLAWVERKNLAVRDQVEAMLLDMLHHRDRVF